MGDGFYMEAVHFFEKMDDGTEIAVHRWIPDGEIKGIVQISHGMTEHAMRYERLGTMLAAAGYVCNAHDHRGHGRTAQRAVEKGTGMFGYLAEHDGFTRVTDDLHAVLGSLQRAYPGKKTVLIGHSFGSFVAQSYIERYGSCIDSCILIGTAGPRRLLIAAGKMLVSGIGMFCGDKACSRLADTVTFGTYNSRIRHPCSAHAWLNRDENMVRTYDQDPWCGFIPTISFFKDLLDGLRAIHTRQAMRSIPSELPVYLLYGGDDPVGGYGKTVRKLYRCYISNGMSRVQLKCYPGARHEILHELNKNEVFEDILDWIHKTL